MRRKLSMSNAENADGQMRCEIDASNQKRGPEKNIRNDGQDAEGQTRDRHGHDRALHQGDRRGKGKHGGADHGSHTGKNFCGHTAAPMRLFM
jgi:hypothetical protein